MTPQELAIWAQLMLVDQLATVGPASRDDVRTRPSEFPVSVRYYKAIDEIAAGRPHEWVLDNTAWFAYTDRIPLERAS